MSATSSRIPFSRHTGHVCRVAAVAFLLLSTVGGAGAQEESLGDYARRIRTPKTHEVLVSAEDAATLFKSVDEITRFSSQDSGLPRLTSVKRKLIGHTEAEKHFRIQNADEAQNDRRIDESATVLKKFGMLPSDFDVNATLQDMTLNGIAGFYDFKDQTMYLLDWIAPEMQKMVMAHELTHALQDQNFHLATFASRPRTATAAAQMKMDQSDSGEELLARRAVVEGQASVVGDDYAVKALGVSLTDSSEARQVASSYLQASHDPSVVIHNAPRLLREIMIFPYREGLQFELELLNKGGRPGAFQQVFKRPPVNTHQILQPEAYLKNEKAARVEIADLTPVFGKDYEAYDSGSIGELDVQIMSEEFGCNNDIYTVARKWDGGAYVAVKRAGLSAGAEVKTADLALVYLSRWKDREAAERFGRIYLQGLSKRMPMAATQPKCEREQCSAPLWEQHASSSEGPVNIELWPGNLLLITQSVDDARMQALRAILLGRANSGSANANATRAGVNQPELAPRLFAMPQIQALSVQEGISLSLGLREQLTHQATH